MPHRAVIDGLGRILCEDQDVASPRAESRSQVEIKAVRRGSRCDRTVFGIHGTVHRTQVDDRMLQIAGDRVLPVFEADHVTDQFSPQIGAGTFVKAEL